MESNAVFSDDRKYRYYLWRCWDKTGPALTMICLNPSTADEHQDDATVTRAIVRNRGLGFGQLRMVNLFALRSTDPNELLGEVDPIGPDNDFNILNACRGAMMVICAWGSHKAIGTRAREVLADLRRAEIPLHYLKLSKGGQPYHPLYLPYSLKPSFWKGEP